MKRKTKATPVRPGISEKQRGEQLLADLLADYRRKAQVEIAELVFSHLNHKPIVANALVEGCTFWQNDGGLSIRPATNGTTYNTNPKIHVLRGNPMAEPKRRMSAAGRARIAAAARKRWREYNKKKGAKK